MGLRHVGGKSVIHCLWAVVKPDCISLAPDLLCTPSSPSAHCPLYRTNVLVSNTSLCSASQIADKDRPVARKWRFFTHLHLKRSSKCRSAWHMGENTKTLISDPGHAGGKLLSWSVITGLKQRNTDGANVAANRSWPLSCRQGRGPAYRFI